MIVLAVSFAGCSSNAKMVHSQTTPEFKPGTVRKVYIVGVAEDKGLRRKYEDAFVADLKKRDLDAGVSYEMVPDLSKVDKEAVAASLRKEGYSHVLVTRIVRIEDKETYVPPSTMSVGVGGYPGYYGGWYPYMSMSYGYVTSPGYTTIQRQVGLETNIYDLGNEKMIYTGMTDVFAGEETGSRVVEFIETVVWDLRSKGVIG
jgi:hypothetical protein